MLPLKDDVIIQHCHHSFLAIYESTPIMALIMTVGGSLWPNLWGCISKVGAAEITNALTQNHQWDQSMLFVPLSSTLETADFFFKTVSFITPEICHYSHRDISKVYDSIAVALYQIKAYNGSEQLYPWQVVSYLILYQTVIKYLKFKRETVLLAILPETKFYIWLSYVDSMLDPTVSKTIRNYFLLNESCTLQNIHAPSSLRMSKTCTPQNHQA